MKLKLKYPVLLIILSFIFCSCEKEYSIEGNVAGNTAVFIYPGAPSTCNSALVVGVYEVGTAMAATNVVTISVEVTTPGTYTVATATVNGITFSGSGTFTTNGSQTISLTGTGIPVLAGTFSYTPGTNGCSFPVTVSGGGGGGSGVFTYDGAPGPCANPIPAGTYLTGNALTASNTITVAINVSTIGSWSVSTPQVNGFSFSGSGSFVTTGNQTITLTGTGTPTAEGSFDFTLPNNGCSFSITVGPGIPLTDFLRCTIDGVATTFNENIATSNPDPTSFSLGGNETTAANSPTFQIDLANSPVITIGNYDQVSATNLTTFCIGSYFDGVAATAWTIGILGQTGSFSVNVTSYTANRIEGTFSGTIYDNNGSGSGEKTITLGEFGVSF